MADRYEYWNKEMELNKNRKDLDEIQNKRLRAIVKYCYEKVPFYNKRFKEINLHPDDIKTKDDITKIPITYKQDLRDNYPFNMFAVPMKDIVRIHASSGTTGKPTVVGYTKKDIETWTELMARTVMAPNITKEDIIQNAYGYGLFTGGLGFHYGAEKIGATVIPISGGNTERQILIMQDFKSTVITCTPSYSLYIAEYLKNLDIDVDSLSLRVGIFGAEPWSETLRTKIEDALHIDAIDIYGLSELCGPGVSVECPEKAGLHIWEDHFIPEIIDPKTHEQLSIGEQGALVFTTLTKEGIPLLRYLTNDISILNTEKCNCGRWHTRMRKVIGRADDMLIVRGINVFPSEVEYQLMKVPGVSENYQIIVDRDILDRLTIKVEVTPEAFSDKVSEMEQFKKQIEKQLDSSLQIHANIELVAPGKIERSIGKAKRVIDLRSKNI
ncbi:MAG: phenylacetate--CoA ligase family protein [Candidatus Helarchaeota archaeon]